MRKKKVRLLEISKASYSFLKRAGVKVVEEAWAQWAIKKAALKVRRVKRKFPSRILSSRIPRSLLLTLSTWTIQISPQINEEILGLKMTQVMQDRQRSSRILFDWSKVQNLVKLTLAKQARRKSMLVCSNDLTVFRVSEISPLIWFCNFPFSKLTQI